MTDQRILLYDGYCQLCSAAVRFVLRHSDHSAFRFLPLHTPETTALLKSFTLPEKLPDSLILISGTGIYLRSNAALRIAARLKFPWNLLVVFYLVPRFIRDPFYDWIARKRYRWFGRNNTCYLP